MKTELYRTKKMAGKFVRSGLILPWARDVIFSPNRPRNFVEDMRLLSQDQPAQIEGVENIPGEGGALLIINHPEMDITASAVFSLPVAISDQIGRDDISVLLGFKIRIGPLAVPASDFIMDSLMELYPGHFFMVSKSKNEKAKSYRHRVKTMAASLIDAGHLFLLSPEANISRDGSVLPTSTFRHGAGELGQIVSALGRPVIPTAIWVENGNVRVRLGPGFFVPDTISPEQAVFNMMGQVAALLPHEFRGPYQDS